MWGTGTDRGTTSTSGNRARSCRGTIRTNGTLIMWGGAFRCSSIRWMQKLHSAWFHSNQPRINADKRQINWETARYSPGDDLAAGAYGVCFHAVGRWRARLLNCAEAAYMTTVQIAIDDRRYAGELCDLLVADGTHSVHVLDRPSPK